MEVEMSSLKSCRVGRMVFGGVIDGARGQGQTRGQVKRRLRGRSPPSGLEGTKRLVRNIHEPLTRRQHQQDLKPKAAPVLTLHFMVC